ncbi:SIMPL domain-containing protein [Selenomonas sp.]|uniref:SIMPL domain-containing protein n=1 Tax=Selenomonas sp. TaxID=2053611 RepID=UPI0025E011D9|nr:SIMPL domain-containing protein [Selenomonas sp.]MCI6283147.1 SIMPL domain-containing protein [Selenomonas sp.]
MMNSLKHIACAFALAALLVTPQFASAEAADQPQRPILSVDGRGTANTEPDMATVAVGITTYATDAGKAQNDNAWVAGEIQKAIAQLGIADKDIQTRNYSFRPTYRQDKGHENEINGYTVDNTVIVTVRDVKLTGKVIDAALSHGANEISSLDFSASNTQGVRKEALRSAVNDARDKANVIASALGKKIVGVQNVSESTGYLETRRFAGNMMLAMAKDVETPVAPGSLSLSANVHIDFILSD